MSSRSKLLLTCLFTLQILLLVLPIAANQSYTSSFSATKIAPSAFVIQESDAYGEDPLIYVKLHPKLPVVILTDTGCNSPSRHRLNDTYTHLRDFLENALIPANHGAPLNPHGERAYVIISTHLHYDHVLGIPQFVESPTEGFEGERHRRTEIVASAAGRDFIESDFVEHGLFPTLNITHVPWYNVTHYAQAFERLHYPFENSIDAAGDVLVSQDMDVMTIHVPGHTPDSLAWYDRKEMQLYVGDHLYAGQIIFPAHGSMVEWWYSNEKLAAFVRSENAHSALREAKDMDPRRVAINAGHDTVGDDAESLVVESGNCFMRAAQGEMPLAGRIRHNGVDYGWWKEDVCAMSFLTPLELMHEAREFFLLQPGMTRVLPRSSSIDRQSETAATDECRQSGN